MRHLFYRKRAGKATQTVTPYSYARIRLFATPFSFIIILERITRRGPMNRNEYADLHLHSRFSDGLHSPSDLVRIASEKGLKTIAVADHDSVAGIDEAMEAGKRHGVEIIPAVELSVSYRGLRDVHLLGYLIDHHDPLFVARLEEFRKSRIERGMAILERINSRLSAEKKENISCEEVLNVAEGAVGRPHIAGVLVEKGLARSYDDAFERYLVPCNVPKFQIHVADAIGEVKRIGGVAVLAHPSSICKDTAHLREIIGEFSGMGLDGLELYSNMCYKDDITFFNDLASKWGLIVTGGSDFHGFNEDEEMGRVRNGVKIPYSLVIGLKEAQVRNAGRMEGAVAV
jgi:3',5'-nucleoside bisphosphate phosphatase